MYRLGVFVALSASMYVVLTGDYDGAKVLGRGMGAIIIVNEIHLKSFGSERPNKIFIFHFLFENPVWAF